MLKSVIQYLQYFSCEGRKVWEFEFEENYTFYSFLCVRIKVLQL